MPQGILIGGFVNVVEGWVYIAELDIMVSVHFIYECAIEHTHDESVSRCGNDHYSGFDIAICESISCNGGILPADYILTGIVSSDSYI